MKGLFLKFAAILLVLLGTAYFWSLQLTRNPFPTKPEKPIVTAVLFNGNKQDGGWNEAHYQGFEEVRKNMKVKIIYREYLSDMDDSALDAIDELVHKEKAEIIFATSFNYGPALLKAAQKYPNVKFFHAAGDKTADNMAVYFGRMEFCGMRCGWARKSNVLPTACRTVICCPGKKNCSWRTGMIGIWGLHSEMDKEITI